MKKFSALFLAATVLTASVAVPVIEPTVEAASTKSFSDVSKNNTYYDIIHEMTQQGIIKGYDDGTFKPEQALSRKHAAELVYRLGKLKKVSTSKTVPKDLTTKHPNYEAIMMLYKHGLLVLDSKGNINPNAELSRGEMAKILATTFELKGSKHPLTDVSKGMDSYVSALYENNVTTGFEDRTFKEDQSLTRAHYAVFMHRAMNATGELKIEEPKEQTKNPQNSDSSKGNSSNSNKGDSPTEKLFDDSALGKIRENDGITVLPKDKPTLTKEELTEKLEREFAKIKAEKSFTGQSGLNPAVMKKEKFIMLVEGLSKSLGITPETLINQITKAYEEGVVVTNDGVSEVPYALYFNYNTGMLYMGDKR